MITVLIFMLAFSIILGNSPLNLFKSDKVEDTAIVDESTTSDTSASSLDNLITTESSDEEQDQVEDETTTEEVQTTEVVESTANLYNTEGCDIETYDYIMSNIDIYAQAYDSFDTTQSEEITEDFSKYLPNNNVEFEYFTKEVDGYTTGATLSITDNLFGMNMLLCGNTFNYYLDTQENKAYYALSMLGESVGLQKDYEIDSPVTVYNHAYKVGDFEINEKDFTLYMTTSDTEESDNNEEDENIADSLNTTSEENMMFFVNNNESKIEYMYTESTSPLYFARVNNIATLEVPESVKNAEQVDEETFTGALFAFVFASLDMSSSSNDSDSNWSVVSTHDFAPNYNTFDTEAYFNKKGDTDNYVLLDTGDVIQLGTSDEKYLTENITNRLCTDGTHSILMYGEEVEYKGNNYFIYIADSNGSSYQSGKASLEFYIDSKISDESDFVSYTSTTVKVESLDFIDLLESADYCELSDVTDCGINGMIFRSEYVASHPKETLWYISDHAGNNNYEDLENISVNGVATLK